MSAALPPTQPLPSSNNATIKQVATSVQRPQPTKKHPPTEMLPPPPPQKKILENEVTALSNCFRVRMLPIATPVPLVLNACVECSSRYSTDLQVSRPSQTSVSVRNAMLAAIEAHPTTPVVSTITPQGHHSLLLPLSVGRSKSLINSVTHWSRVWYECFLSCFRRKYQQ
jgi:hypothetical protein